MGQVRGWESPGMAAPIDDPSGAYSRRAFRGGLPGRSPLAQDLVRLPVGYVVRSMRRSMLMFRPMRDRGLAHGSLSAIGFRALDLRASRGFAFTEHSRCPPIVSVIQPTP